MYNLIGSKPSPFVRRIRVFLEENNIPYEFEVIDVMSSEGQERLSEYGPIKRVPVLVKNDSGEVFRDSYLIVKYHEKVALSRELEEDLLLLNELCNSALLLLQFKRFKLDENHENLLSKSHLKRIDGILEYFNTSELDSFGLVQQWLFCSLDWFDFRDIVKWRTRYSNLEAFFGNFKDRPSLVSSDPRN